ncbi:HAD family hydrolase [Lacrimispora saccharolytica]|uniref:HAD-superfamily hydrolase, subfamily IA, variant 1 n=1 Tax=Lacrimispora saccharolytica (strain ATCC 35040 / DSM 2544 / NRCC 2533 / WM1) TaxID=610130 RepID=D9R2C6_LACSW|nr:HAD family hydrolase [Lacrimispora saccharolytica]ADL04776.1 HAD-superfamily hydrolase, subfamily IA, variant 1 [[Clostridium] saccharolyticum WM1]QRV21006.1 HAD family hydrolase [Lacrimispora saccharolytica]
MNKDYFLFDLDGTLTDPKEGITKSVQYALRHFDIEVNHLDELCCFIGPPLKDSFMEYYGFSEKQAREAIDIYREYFSGKGLYENKAYDGVAEVLQSFLAAGKKLYVASSKPEIFVRKILKHFELDSFFLFMGGADMEETRVKKADVIRYVLKECGIRDLDKTVMIGDRKHDVLGAKETGIASVGVLYGYGSRQELKEAGADVLAETIFDLQNLI